MDACPLDRDSFCFQEFLKSLDMLLDRLDGQELEVRADFLGDARHKSPQGVRVSSVRHEEDNLLEPMGAEAETVFLQDLHKGLQAQRNGSWKIDVMSGQGGSNQRCHQGV